MRGLVALTLALAIALAGRSTARLVTFLKGANCYARAAGVISVGGSVDSSTEARMFEEALDCGNAAEGNGANLLYEADAKGKELKAKYG